MPPDRACCIRAFRGGRQSGVPVALKTRRRRGAKLQALRYDFAPALRGPAPDCRSSRKCRPRPGAGTFCNFVVGQFDNFKTGRANYKITDYKITKSQSMPALHQFEQYTRRALRMHEHIAMSARARLDLIRYQAHPVAFQF